MKNGGWRLVKLGQLLKKSEEWIELSPEEAYREVTVKLWGKGILQRREVTGAEIVATRRNRAHANQFIVSRIDARNGAFGIIPDSLEGAIVSNDFPVFTPNPALIFPSFVGWLSKTKRFVDICKSASEGTTNRVRLVEERFLNTLIEIPSISEQKRIVVRIESLAAKMEEANKIHHITLEEIETFRRRIIDMALSRAPSARQPLEQFLSEPLINGLSIPASEIGSGILFAKVGVVNSGVFNSQEMKQANIDLPSNSPYWLKPSDIVISRGNSKELVGRAAVYEGNPPQCAFPDLLIRVRVKKEALEPRFIAVFFHSSEARVYIESQISGTSSTMPKISQPKLMAMPVPVISIADQRRIMTWLDMMSRKIEELTQWKNQTTAELDALLPSILDKAFKGEL